MAQSTNQSKKQRELLACETVALEINKLEGTDFHARLTNSEPADAELVSTSGKCPPRPAQVVTIPRDIHHREDNQNLEGFERDLTASLKELGVGPVFIAVIPGAKAVQYGMKAKLVRQLAEFVHGANRSTNMRLDYPDILDSVPEVAEYVHQVFISHWDDQTDIDVDIPGPGGALPRDGRWIEEGIHLKVNKYGGPEQVKDLMLVIDAVGFVDREQVEAFKSTRAPAELPFGEIWIVTPFDGTIPLKRRS